MLDGFYIAYPSIKEHRHLPGAKTATSILLLAIDAYTHEPLHWHIYQRFEDVRAWNMFFAELVKLGFSPKYLVHDGHSGIQRASAIYLPEARHQRCLVHMVRGAHRKLGITPKSPLARQLQSLIHHLVTVRTHAGKAVWLAAWGDYLAAFEYAESTNTPQTNALRGLKAILMHAYERDELFIQSVRLNGKKYDKTYITHQDILQGGTLEFKMGEKPSSWGKKPEMRPVEEPLM
jgi:hypothetical protein